MIKHSNEYRELLYKAGQTINHLEVFINTFGETGIVSKRQLKCVQEFLRKKLMTEEANSVLLEYNNETERVSKIVREDAEKYPTIIDKDFEAQIERELDAFLERQNKEK